jgi:hypothetical protein
MQLEARATRYHEGMTTLTVCIALSFLVFLLGTTLAGSAAPAARNANLAGAGLTLLTLLSLTGVVAGAVPGLGATLSSLGAAAIVVSACYGLYHFVTTTSFSRSVDGRENEESSTHSSHE